MQQRSETCKRSVRKVLREVQCRWAIPTVYLSVVIVPFMHEVTVEWICIKWAWSVVHCSLHRQHTLVIKFRSELPARDMQNSFYCFGLLKSIVWLCVLTSSPNTFPAIVFSIRFDYSKVHLRNFAFWCKCDTEPVYHFHGHFVRAILRINIHPKQWKSEFSIQRSKNYVVISTIM